MSDSRTNTPWGYSVTGELPSLIDVSTFDTLSGARFDDSNQVEVTLAAVSAAVRCFCGWHVAPNIECYCETNGPGRMITLPTLMMTDLISVDEHGETLDVDDIEWLPSGLVRKPPSMCWHHPGWHPKWRSVHVTYMSGYDTSMVPDLAAIVAQIASNNLAAPGGIRSERAGNVEIAYNSMASGVSGGITLLSRDMAMLASYRLPVMVR